ncbi:MAG: 7-cyano-7-deazaguanine synthase [Phycisphaerae bacterium]|nr:7-cyano-7-deazaguanine synthase [Phycisphaerae bacterium]
MRKIICAPENIIPQQLEEDTKYFSTYSNTGREHVGYFGSTLIRDIQRVGIRPSEKVWDFNTIALAVAAADNSLTRSNSADGWTRQIELTVHLCNPGAWEPVKQKLEKTLRFLTGDFWSLNLKDDGVNPPRAKRQKRYDCDCVSLLSGGVDSLVGAIDLTANDHKPIFVSQVVRGDAETQRAYAGRIRSESPHFQWSHKIHPPQGESEGSTRGRSIVFFAFAALATSAIEVQPGSPVDIFVPENGFISLNIPLNSGRMGSFSTKTSHPVYLKGIQNIWHAVGISINLIMPYQFKTKGEILAECKNQHLLKELVFQSVSCGKYRVYKMQHCGRCVPCLVRRAAFKHWGEVDETSGGYYSDQLDRINQGNPDDVGAVSNACLVAEQSGIQRLISGNLSFADQERNDFEGVFSRGLNEVGELLREKGVI